MNDEEKELIRACTSILDEIEVSDEEIEKAISNYNMSKTDHFVNIKGKRKISRTAIAVTAAICCLVLISGGIAYAFYHDAIIDYFFGQDSNKANVFYNSENRVYSFGKNKLVLHGTICDESTGVAYLSFEAYDSENTPIKDKLEVQTGTAFIGSLDPLMRRNISLISYIAGDDVYYIIISNCNGWQCRTIGNISYLKCYFNPEINKKDNSFGYLVLDKNGVQEFLNDYNALDVNQILYGGDERNFLKLMDEQGFDIKQVQPEMLELLDNHGLEKINSDNLTVKYVNIDGVSVILGKTDCFVKYNLKDNIDRISVLREDGTVIQIIKDGELVTNGQYSYGGIDEKSGDVYYQYGYGLVLDDKEKVAVIINDSIIK